MNRNNYGPNNEELARMKQELIESDKKFSVQIGFDLGLNSKIMSKVEAQRLADRLKSSDILVFINEVVN